MTIKEKSPKFKVGDKVTITWGIDCAGKKGVITSVRKSYTCYMYTLNIGEECAENQLKLTDQKKSELEIRAEREIPYTYSCHGEILDELQTNDERKIYIRACRDQQKIDIEKACEWLRKNFNQVLRKFDGGEVIRELFTDEVESRFKQAIEE